MCLVVLPLFACSSDDGAAHAQDAGYEADLIVPRGLRVQALPGGNGVLEMTALTLRAGPLGPELYAALKNQGAVPACDAALSVELFDHAEQSLAAGISGLLTQRFYRLGDGSAAVAACVGPGDATMAAITDLPAELAVDDVGYVVYRCPYFALEVEPIDGIELRDIERVTVGGETAYRGTFVNQLDLTVRNPSVTVYPVNRVGRPLGAAIASEMVDVVPAGGWHFETGAIADAGSDQVAFPAGALVTP